MFLTCKDYRREASLACKLNSGRLALITLIYVVISNAFSISTETENMVLLIVGLGLSMVGIFISGPLQYGYLNTIIINYENGTPTVGDLFSGFKYFWKLFVLTLLIAVYTFLWSLLFIIPGIIKSISYSRAFFIFYENPELSASECIKRSKELMDGHKWTYFKLMLSYLGWLILCVLTLGILTLWVAPKMRTADYILYKVTKGEEIESLEEY